MTVRFTAYGTPAPKGSMKSFWRPGMVRPVVTHDNARTRPWAAVVSDAAAQASPSVAFPRGVPVQVQLAFALPRPTSEPKRRATAPVRKPDLDKLTRLVLDACTGLVWQDDSQVVEVIARKAFVEAPGGQPRVEVSVEPIDLREAPWAASIAASTEAPPPHRRGPLTAAFDAIVGIDRDVYDGLTLDD